MAAAVPAILQQGDLLFNTVGIARAGLEHRVSSVRDYQAFDFMG